MHDAAANLEEISSAYRYLDALTATVSARDGVTTTYAVRRGNPAETICA